MSQRKSVDDRIKWSFGTEQVSNESITESKTPEVKFIGGVYRSSLPTYTNGQNVIASFTSDGKLRTDASVTIEDVSLHAEMKVDSGHDLYEAENVTRTGDLAISFTSVAGLTLAHVQSVENKTKGWIYNTKGATVTNTAITLVAGSQKSGYPVIAVADEVEVIYRGTSRFTNKTQMTQITDGTNQATVLVQDAAFGTASKGLPLFGKYQASPTTYSDGDAAPILLDENGRIVLESDIQIGAVELKDSDTDNRANVKAANTSRTTGTFVLATQNVGADGTVNPTGSLNTNAPFTKLTDGTSNLTLGTGTTKTVPSELHDGTTKIIFGTGTIKTVPARITDGTNYQPTMDAVARSGYVRVTDGTNTLPTMDAVGRRGYVTHTDGTNTMPTMDVEARAGFVKLAEEAKTTPSIPPYTHSSGREDFTADYTSDVTLTLAGTPTTIANKHLVGIRVNTTAGTSSKLYINGMNGISMSIASNVITISGAGTPFASGDSYDVMVNLYDKAYDVTLDSLKTIIQNPRSALSEVIINTTNIAAATTYYPSSVGKEMGNYEHLSFGGRVIIGSGQTITVALQVTNGADPATAIWHTIYFYDAENNTAVNVISASDETKTFSNYIDVANFRYYRYVVTPDSATNTVLISERKF